MMWAGFLPNFKLPEPDPDAWPQFRLKGGPLDTKYQEVPPQCIEDAKKNGCPVTFTAPIQGGEVMYQQVGDTHVLEYVCVRFFD